jgi:hypothetical protein
MRQIAILVGLALGCSGAKPAQVSMTETDRLRERLAERERLRSIARTDVVAALLELGVGENDFEPIAKALYLRWKVLHPDPIPTPRVAPNYTPPPPVYVPPTPAALPVAAADTTRWWCFHDRDIDACFENRAVCDDKRADIGNFKDCDKEVAAGLTPKQARDICVDVRVQITHISECEQQSRAACFGVRRVLYDALDSMCSSTITSCKARRVYVQKKLSADFKIMSDCKPID